MDLVKGELVLSNTASEKEWLAARRSGIGASEIAAAAGLSTRRGPWDVWDAKVNGTEFEPTDHMRWGTWIESRIVDWWAAETGRTVGAGGLFRHPQHRWLLATPDALVLEGEQPPRRLDGKPARGGTRGFVPVATVDAKNAGSWNLADWGEDGAPIDYLAQITQQMLAVGVPDGFLVAAIGGAPPVERHIVFDEEFGQALIGKGERLWQQVQDKTPPPPDGSRSSMRWLKNRYPDADPDFFRELDDADVAALKDKLAIDRQIKELEKIAAEIEAAIKAKLATASAGLYQGQPYVTWKTSHRAGYVKTVEPGTVRTFRIPAAAKREMGYGERE